MADSVVHEARDYSTGSAHAARTAPWRRVLAWSRRLFSPLAIAFLGYAVWSERALLAEALEAARWGPLAAAVLLWAVLHSLAPVLALVLFRPAGITVGYRQAFLIHASRLPARYIPGGIWHTVGRAVDYHQMGVPPRLLAAFVSTEHALALGVALLPGALVVYRMEAGALWDGAALLAVVASAVGLVVLLPVLNRTLLRPTPLTARRYAILLLLYATFWCGAASAFVLYAGALQGIGAGVSAWQLGGAYLFGWGIGFLAVFAPQGIGVFEAVTAALLAADSGLGGAAALVAGFRLVVLAADLCVWLLSTAMRGVGRGGP